MNKQTQPAKPAKPVKSIWPFPTKEHPLTLNVIKQQKQSSYPFDVPEALI